VCFRDLIVYMFAVWFGGVIIVSRVVGGALGDWGLC
jgi:hypothetical protein